MEQLSVIRSLSIDECRSSINNWIEKKVNYSNIEKLIDPKNIFCIQKEDLDWIKKFNKKDYFYLFAGIHDEKLIFIVAPMDSSGKVNREIQSFLYLTPSYLDNNINLIEHSSIQKITTLTNDYILLHNTNETINLSSENDPSISEENAITRIKWWLEQSLDWFFCECNELNGARIFNAFKVPLFDLDNNTEINKIYCIFGFKRSHIYNMLIPVINFIAVDTLNNQHNIISIDGSNKKSNIGDFSSPCPPFCKEKVTFL